MLTLVLLSLSTSILLFPSPPSSRRRTYEAVSPFTVTLNGVELLNVTQSRIMPRVLWRNHSKRFNDVIYTVLLRLTYMHVKVYLLATPSGGVLDWCNKPLPPDVLNDKTWTQFSFQVIFTFDLCLRATNTFYECHIYMSYHLVKRMSQKLTD